MTSFKHDSRAVGRGLVLGFTGNTLSFLLGMGLAWIALSLSLSLSCVSPEIVWRSNRCVIYFTGQGAYFIVKLFYFHFDFILHVHPNMHKDVKYFPNSIYSRNKGSLKLNLRKYLFICSSVWQTSLSSSPSTLGFTIKQVKPRHNNVFMIILVNMKLDLSLYNVIFFMFIV